MRLALAVLLLATTPALAQTQAPPQPGSFNGMSAADAARLNQAVQNDPKGRAALDKVEQGLNQSGHRAGQLLEKTRP